ncbi:MAG: nucleotidyltransferase domain-containing protein [Candidatus Edwardsbacteria bacterium]
MPPESSPSVKISYFPKENVWEAVQALARQLLREHQEICRIILFGSLVRGDAVPGSDVDLLIILKGSNEPFLQRIVNYLPTQFPVGIDVFPYTETELKMMLEQGNYFLQKALKEGIEISH